MNNIDLLNSQTTMPVVTVSGDISEPLYGLLAEAVEKRATDVHLDPVENGITVRFRIDGFIHHQKVLAADIRQKISTQTKVAAGFNIDRSFVPQEGTLTLAHHDEKTRRYDIRVAIIPAGHGREAIHFRFLTGRSRLMNLKELGMSTDHRRLVEQVLGTPRGVILIAGITGAGKSSTLYSIANTLDLTKHVGVSIEDPIETYIPDLRQIEVNYEHDLTMYNGLRALLRMDPDAIFVGEIRDRNSAITTARAGIAGRLAVATLHAPDPATVIEAMNHFKVPRYITASSLRLIISQHLLRRICIQCATTRELTDTEKTLFSSYQVEPPTTVLEPGQCSACRHYGYSGRVGVFEVTSISNALAQDIADGLGKTELLERFRRDGGPSFMVDALHKVKEEAVSLADVHRLHRTSENRRPL